MGLFGKRATSLAEAAPKIPLSEMIKRTRILVIDDVESEFPFRIMRDQGYAIDYWPDVKDLRALDRGDYDIIILDIGGVGRELDPQNEGAAVLKHLKSTNPSQIVVAFSGQSHVSERIPFFKLADQYVPKPATALTWKETLDELISTKVNVSHYWWHLKNILAEGGRTPQEIARLEAALVKAAQNKDSDKAKAFATTLSVASNTLTIGAIVAKVIGLLL